MAYIINKTPKVSKKPSLYLAKPETRKLPYEIPERYQNSFYLANASVFDSVNWFLHRAYEVFFPSLRRQIQNLSGSDKCSVDESIDKLNNIIQVFDNCNSLTDVRFPVKKDNGYYEVIRGFLGQYGLATGQFPCLGGLRLHENITRDQIKGLSTLTMYKNSCIGLTFPGTHGGIKINPKLYSENELKCIVKQYAAELFNKGLCGGKSNILHPDINTSEREMNWVSNTYAELTGCTTNTASTGKGTDNDGLEGFEKSSSLGALHAMEFILSQDKLLEKIRFSKGLKDKTFIIQGLGKTGANLAQNLVDSGAICVGVKEVDAYLYDSKGINLKELFEHIKTHGSIKNYGRAKLETNDTIYGEYCDILILAGCHKSLICYTADKVQARLIVEAADGPMSPASHRILTHSKLVIPDLFACSGCSIASGVEYLRNLQQLNVSASDTLRYSDKTYDKILNLLSSNIEQKMTPTSAIQTVPLIRNDSKLISNSIEMVIQDVGHEILDVLEEFQLGLDFRTAAYIVSLQKMYRKIIASNKYV